MAKKDDVKKPVFSLSLSSYDPVSERRAAGSMAEEALEQKASISYDPPERVAVSRVINRHNRPYVEQLESLTDDKGAKPVWKLIRDMYERGALANTVADDREYDYNGEPNMDDEGIDFQGMEFDDLQRMNSQLQSVIKQKTAEIKAQAAAEKARQTRDKASQTASTATVNDKPLATE